jgi:Tol biopolymer transport system component
LTSKRDFGPSVSPDGREVIYTNSADKSTIWKIGIDGGQPVQLTDVQSDFPIFSPDGSQFVCSYRVEPKSRDRIAILASGGGPPVKTFPQPSGFSMNARWMPDGGSIVYGVRKGGVTNLWAQPIDGGEPKQITRFTSDLIHSFDISRDGKQIAFTKRTGTSDVVLITGFRK